MISVTTRKTLVMSNSAWVVNSEPATTQWLTEPLPRQCLVSYRDLLHHKQMDPDIADYLGFHLQLLSPRPLVEWLPVLADFVAAEIVPRISPAARDAVALHRSKEHRLAIITVTHSFLSSAIGELFGVPVIAPRAEVRGGHLSGRIEGALCFREKKLTCLSIWMESEGLGDEAIGERYFYSDSANDLSLLEAVSHPVTVNPDSRLAVLAQHRGWPMLRWRCA
ncbi:MAG TPA: HAD-IB family hydrolase [Polaromonas sp.]|nr:HAD-IB family hydrolase [Polaromonas sp.]